jgi:hypothetical protein
MALTPRRWIVIWLLACAAVAVWQLPSLEQATTPRGGSPSAVVGGRFLPGYGYLIRYGWPDVESRLETANTRLRVLEMRDSIFTARTTAPTGPWLTVLVDADIPRADAQRLTATLRQTWQGFTPDARFPVAVAVVEDTARTNGGLPVLHAGWVQAYTFPPDSLTPVCRAIVRIATTFGRPTNSVSAYLQRNTKEALHDPATLRRVLGPCALYATFGAPGPLIAGWLQRTGWQMAQEMDWSRVSPAWREDERFDDALVAGQFLPETNAWRLRDALSNDGVACMAGRAGACAAGVLNATWMSKDDRAWYQSVIGAHEVSAYLWASWGWQQGFGPAEGWMLSDMVHDLGRKRFETFWASPQAPATAFETAAGQPLGQWVESWTQRTYGRDELGPWLPVHDRLAGLLVIGAGVLLALVFARERRVA